MFSKIKQKLFLLAIISFIIAVNTTCSDDGKPTSLEWELPQPMDTLLFGSWERTVEDFFITKKIITFYENNKYDIEVIENNKYDIHKDQLWQVDNDTLILNFMGGI